MYILSRDRLNMDLDRACLELMIKLLEMDQLIPLQPAPQDPQDQPDQLSPKEVAKVKEKIRKLCETVHNKHLDLENITVSRAHSMPCEVRFVFVVQPQIDVIM